MLVGILRHHPTQSSMTIFWTARLDHLKIEEEEEEEGGGEGEGEGEEEGEEEE